MEEWEVTHVRALRLALRLSQEKFAETLGASCKTVSNWERGLNPPGLDMKDRLDRVLSEATPEQRKRFAYLLGRVEHTAEVHVSSATPAELVGAQELGVGPERGGEEPTNRRQALRAAGAVAATTFVPDPVDQSLRLLEAFRGCHIGAQGLDQIEASVDRLAREYFDKPFNQLLDEATGLRQITLTLMRGTTSLAEQRHLGLMTGLLSAMLGALSLDTGDFTAADVHLDVAWRLASDIKHDRLCSWVRALQSNSAFYRGDPRRALELSRAGQTGATPAAGNLRLMAFEARALARLGDNDGADRALRKADLLVDSAGLEGPGHRVFDYDLAQYTVATSTSHVWIGQFGRAREHAERALSLFDARYPSTSNSLIARVDLALVELHEGELERALALGHEVLGALRGESAAARLRDLDNALSPLRSSRAVSEFHERVLASR